MSQTNIWGTPDLFFSDVSLSDHSNATLVPALSLFTVRAYNRSVTYSLTKSSLLKIDILTSPALPTPSWLCQTLPFDSNKHLQNSLSKTIQRQRPRNTSASTYKLDCITVSEFLCPITTGMFLLPAKSHMQKANWREIILKEGAHSSGGGTLYPFLSIALCIELGFHLSQNCFCTLVEHGLNCTTEVTETAQLKRGP